MTRSPGARGGSSAMPQQKIVEVLANRLKHKVSPSVVVVVFARTTDVTGYMKAAMQFWPTIRPRRVRPAHAASYWNACCAPRDSLDMIEWALCELLGRLAKVCPFFIIVLCRKFTNHLSNNLTCIAVDIWQLKSCNPNHSSLKSCQ